MRNQSTFRRDYFFKQIFGSILEVVMQCFLTDMRDARHWYALI